MMLKNDGRQREAQHNMAKWSHHLCVFLFVYFTAEEFPPPPFSNLDLPNHPRKSTKTESEVGTGVEWMGVLHQVRYALRWRKVSVFIHTFAMRSIMLRMRKLFTQTHVLPRL
jgi:hypothetical protein